MKQIRRPLLLLLLLLSPLQLRPASIFRIEAGRSEITLEFSPYYMPLGWYLPLTSKPIEMIDPKSESEVYSKLLLGALIPRFVVLEVSTYPMPLLGVGIRKWAPDFYNKMTLFEGFNLIESLTTSMFREPWAASLFLGNLLNFTVNRKNSAITNNSSDRPPYLGKGYSGLLVSYGNRHIQNNLLLVDHWLEVELKLKGEHSQADRTMSWSYRVGGRYHSHENIHSYIYLGFKREHTDSKLYRFTLLENSFLDLSASFIPATTQFMSMQLVVGKKFPLRSTRLLPEINIGVAYYFNSRYKDTLIAEDEQIELVISPMISF